MPRQFLAVVLLLTVSCSCSDPLTEQQTPSSAALAQTGAFPLEISLWDGWSFFRFAPEESFDPARLPADDRTRVTLPHSGIFDPAKLPADGWTRVILPHTANIEPRVITEQWQGDALYRRDLIVPVEWEGKAVWLRFEGAMMVARVYLNGARIFEHQGGYLPFTIDLSGKLRFGETNRILVHLDNRDNPMTGPKPLETLDFNYYGGLYREVRLFVRDSLHITDEILANRPASGGIFVTYPSVSQDRAEVSVKTHIANKGSTLRRFTVVHTLMDADQVLASVTSEGRALDRLPAAAGTDVLLASVTSEGMALDRLPATVGTDILLAS